MYVGACVGFVIAVMLLIDFSRGVPYSRALDDRFLFLIFPASFGLIASENSGRASEAFVLLFVVLTNTLWYCGLFTVAVMLFSPKGKVGVSKPGAGSGD
jgi:hypothetical protein